MKQPIKIDITQKVMQQIESENIQIRPHWQFQLLTIAKIVGFVLCIVVAIVTISALVFTLRTDMFKDYLQFGKTGLIDLAKTIPWLAIALFAIVIATVVFIIKNSKPMHRNAFVPVVASLCIVFAAGALIGLYGNQQSLPSKLANGFRLGNEPIKTFGKITSTAGYSITLLTSDGQTLTIEQKAGTKYSGGLPTEGDTVLVLGFLHNGTITAEAIKVEAREEKFEQKSPAQVLPIEQPKQEVEVQKPAPAPAAPKATAPAPTSSAPAATPPPFVKTINITSTSSLIGSGPNYKYKIMWSTNFSSAMGYKMIWAVAPAIPTYPLGSNQNYYYDSGSAGWGYVRNDLTPASGTYNVRVCEYLGGTCSSVYSTTIQVSFP